MLLGHIAVSVLLQHYLSLDPAPVISGGIFPDVVDKPLAHVLQITTSGRMASHTLLGLGISTLLISFIWGRYAARSWALGYLGHLICDSDQFVPWLYPFSSYKFPQSDHSLSNLAWRLILQPNKVELGFMLWATWVMRTQQGSRGAGGQG